MKTIVFYMFSKELRWYHCAQLYAIITLSVKKLVKSYSHIGKHHRFNAVNLVNQRASIFVLGVIIPFFF